MNGTINASTTLHFFLNETLAQDWQHVAFGFILNAYILDERSIMNRTSLLPGLEVGKVKYYCGENVVESYTLYNISNPNEIDQSAMQFHLLVIQSQRIALTLIILN